MKISKNPFLNNKALSFLELLNDTDFTSIELSEYNEYYLRKYLEKPKYNLYLICQLLEQAGTLNAYEQIIDLGGGIGFNSAFIQFLELDSRLVYIDIDEKSTDAAKAIHTLLDLKSHAYYSGDLSALKTQISNKTLICSRDVIEHIYDLRDFFHLSKKAGKNIHNTAAIKNHWIKASEFKQIHKTAELLGNSTIISKERDHKMPYLKLRQQIIRDLFPELKTDRVNIKSIETRGLIAADIEEYIRFGNFPNSHKKMLYSNTCDPYTGNWAERLLSQNDYQLLAGDVVLKFTYSKYNALDNTGIKKWGLACLNFFTNLPIHQLQASFNIVY